MPKLLTKQETAMFLRTSTKTLDRIRNDGELRWIKIRGTIRFIREDVQEYLNKNMGAM